MKQCSICGMCIFGKAPADDELLLRLHKKYQHKRDFPEVGEEIIAKANEDYKEETCG